MGSVRVTRVPAIARHSHTNRMAEDDTFQSKSSTQQGVTSVLTLEFSRRITRLNSEWITRLPERARSDTSPYSFILTKDDDIEYGERSIINLRV